METEVIFSSAAKADRSPTFCTLSKEEYIPSLIYITERELSQCNVPNATFERAVLLPVQTSNWRSEDDGSNSDSLYRCLHLQAMWLHVFHAERPLQLNHFSRLKENRN